MIKNYCYHTRQRFRQAGLTLIELLIVLVVLVAVAGILVPLFPDVLQRAHGSTGADNMKEIAKAVEMHKAMTGGYPNQWDSLIDATGVVAATDLAILDLTPPTPGSVAETVANALADAGITSALQHDDFADATINQTFEGLTAVDELLTNGNVAQLTAAGVTRLGLEATGPNVAAYVAFGLGASSTMVGRSMVDAPVHFLEDSPIEEYARWVVVFAVPNNGPIRLASVGGIHDGVEIEGLSMHLNEYYESLE